MTETTTVNAEARRPRTRKASCRRPAVAEDRSGHRVRGVRRRRSREARNRYGEVFAMTVPVFGDTVFVADPQTRPAAVHRQHRRRQQRPAQPEPGPRARVRCSRSTGPTTAIAASCLRRRSTARASRTTRRSSKRRRCAKAASWPEGAEFETLEPMNRITLNVILRTVFGADGEQLDELREIIPPWVTLGSRMAVLPVPVADLGRLSPWGRLDEYRRNYDAVIDPLIDKVEGRPESRDRDDILALLLRSTYEDGTAMSRQRHRRRAADAARRGTRDHGIDAGVGVRAAHPPPRRPRQARSPRSAPTATSTGRP